MKGKSSLNPECLKILKLAAPLQNIKDLSLNSQLPLDKTVNKSE